MKGKSLVITGGAGFIGTKLVERLVENNEIIVFDNFHRNSLQYSPVRKHKNLTVIKGNILDPRRLKKLPRTTDYVVHMAAIAGVGTVVSNPVTTLKVNLIGTYNVIEYYRSAKIRRFVDFSTSEVYGPHIFRADESGMTTQGPLSEPRWVYAASKLASEFITHGAHREYGLPTVSIRPFNVYGPGQIGEGAIHHFIVNAIHNKPLIVHGDGNSIRSWCYVDDFVSGVILCLQKRCAVGESFNIGNPESTITDDELALNVIKRAGSRSTIRFKKITYPDVDIRVPSIDKARKLLGYAPKVEYDDGILKTIEWYKEHIGK